MDELPSHIMNPTTKHFSSSCDLLHMVCVKQGSQWISYLLNVILTNELFNKGGSILYNICLGDIHVLTVSPGGG